MSTVTLLNPLKEGLLFIVSAPAGTGKTTLIHRLVTEFSSIVASVSFTTRAPRIGEIEGKDYHFISQEAFEKKKAAGDFLEWVRLYDTYYGTSKSFVQQARVAGQSVVLVIDTQGALQLMPKVECVSIFIAPPSIEELRKRLLGRKTESLDIVEKRIAWAQEELKVQKCYDYQMVNDDLEAAYQVLRSIFIAETHRSIYQKN